MRLTELSDHGDLLARVRRADMEVQWVAHHGGYWYSLSPTLAALCAAGVGQARASFDRATSGAALDAADWELLPPVDEDQEVWAAGVTYERSRAARIEESGARDLYSSVYEGARPELFFKAVGRRAVGPDGQIGIRADASWSVPEPELAVVFDGFGETLGFTIGNDVSSRDIEGSNALYLPQAKVYDNSCALGPAIVPAWTLPERPTFSIVLEITRGEDSLFAGAASTGQLRRGWPELGDWLRACMTFEAGFILMTGTGIVPDDSVSLREGDQVSIRIDEIGTLSNGVIAVGRAALS